MLLEFECARCHWIKTEPMPYHSSTTMCQACRRSALPGGKPPPPMRTPNAAHVASLASVLIVLVFIAGVVVGAKMTGGW